MGRRKKPQGGYPAYAFAKAELPFKTRLRRQVEEKLCEQAVKRLEADIALGLKPRTHHVARVIVDEAAWSEEEVLEKPEIVRRIYRCAKRRITKRN